MSAVAKLEALGDRLGTPHTSQVKGSQVGIRELRPRAGRSPWRAFYHRVGDRLAVLADDPEARHDKNGFHRALTLAKRRLLEAEE